MTNSQARVINPVLSAVAQGFSHNAFVGGSLFPVVPVDQRGGKIISFGKEDFMLYNTGRSPGQNTKRVQFGYASGDYVLEQHAIEGTLPMETMSEADVPGIDMASRTIYQTQNIIAMRLEKARADLARATASYAAGNFVTLSGTDQWSDYGATSDPGDDVDVAKETIRSKTGKRPNTMVMGAAVYSKLRRNPKILSFFQYSAGSGQLATVQMLSQYFEIANIQVGDAAFSDDAGVFSDVWGKDVVLAYTETSSLANQGTPTFGYTYQLRNFPMVEEPYYDRSAKSWIYPVTDEVNPVVASNVAGYVIKAAVA
jgi:hypothetical protein